jgi:hypothetical protein
MAGQAAGDLTAQNTFIGPVDVNPGDAVFINTSGTWAGTLTVQAKRSGDASYFDLSEAVFTSNLSRSQVFNETMNIKIGFKTGEYTSGTASIKIWS